MLTAYVHPTPTAPSPPRSSPCSRSLQCHLRAGENLERELLGKLPPKELQALLSSTHRPNFCKQASLPRLCSRTRMLAVHMVAAGQAG